MNRQVSTVASSRAGDYLAGKRVMVTGVCGTVGRQILRHLLAEHDVQSLTGIDHNESELASLAEAHASDRKVDLLLGDVRDASALLRETRRIDVLFHAAAYKHVHICERSPLDAIQTNILGLQNVIQSATENGVQRLVFTSSDKAVNPTNVMGGSKLMGERLVTAAALDPNQASSVFLSTRFGNVLGSRGSVVPIFKRQIRSGGPVTLTDAAMTRFIMSLDDAVRLVVESIVLALPGDVLITKMQAVRIVDLAKVMIREYAPRCGYRPEDIKITVIGQKPGEKLYEELMNEEETRRSYELENYFIVRPALAIPSRETPPYEGLVSASVPRPYNSTAVSPLTQDELAEFLTENGLLDDNTRASSNPCAS
jgi:FlaA1/EpsC-like NDP-sugar epimerase